MHVQLKFLPLALALLCGCSNEFDFAPVSGRVTLDGEPLGGALVSFQPISTGDKKEVGSGSFGEADADGKFVLRGMLNKEEGAIVGSHRVIITTLKGKETPDGGTIITSQERVPAKYQDEDALRFDVPAEGTDQANFELTTGK